MIRKISSRKIFQSLRVSSQRSFCGAVRVSYLYSPGIEQAQFGFSISRKVGIAVVRNKLRRQLRNIVFKMNPKPAPGAYLISLSPKAAELEYQQLLQNVENAFVNLKKKQDEQVLSG